MRKKGVRALLLCMLFLLLSPLRGVGKECEEFVFHDTYPEGYFFCVEDTPPYFPYPPGATTDERQVLPHPERESGNR